MTTDAKYGSSGFNAAHQFDNCEPCWEHSTLQQIERAHKDRKNAARRARHAAYTSLGIKRVTGGLGGVYYVTEVSERKPRL